MLIDKEFKLMQEQMAAMQAEMVELKGFKDIAKAYQTEEYGVKYHQEYEKMMGSVQLTPEQVVKQKRKMRSILEKSKLSKRAHKLEIRYHEGEEWITVESI